MPSEGQTEGRAIHEALAHILTRPGMYVGAPANLAESLWCFICGYDAGLRCPRSPDEKPKELIPKELLRHIQKELGLQFNEGGIIEKLILREGDSESALAGLRAIIGEYYGCTIDRESVPPLKQP